MAATGLFRVVRALGRNGQIIASQPISREAAMARFDEMVAWRMDRVRVVREEDFQTGGPR